MLVCLLACFELGPYFVAQSFLEPITFLPQPLKSEVTSEHHYAQQNTLPLKHMISDCARPASFEGVETFQ